MTRSTTPRPRAAADGPTQPDGSPWPVPPPGGYRLDDLLRLDLPARAELIDGSLVLPFPQQEFHAVTTDLLLYALREAAPGGLRARRQTAVVLSEHTAPVPDVIVVRTDGTGDDGDTDSTGGTDGAERRSYPADGVALAVEVVSPDSRERDRETKPFKYARARIPHYWRVEMSGPDNLPVVHTYVLDVLTFGYVPTGVHRDRLRVDVPFPVTVDLTEIERM
ncbi:Uma2 family endonuclease [Streptomyces sp. NPDC021020]|uniref:Uma2 family endonuclease n=1 Tax=Streptomyces sp. NPDC021020 TaxID=3365109 RepID=UPI0037A46AE9